ncbi:MAG: transglycosylase family protein [Solirubrobacteraceae bacterium]
MRLRTLGAVCVSSAAAAPATVFIGSASAQEATSTLTPLTVPAPSTVQPPGDLHSGAVALASNRHMRFSRRYHRLLGDPLKLSERREIYADLRELTPFRIRVQTRELRRDHHRLRVRLRRKAMKKRRAERKRTGGAPDVPIPGQLSGIAQCESGGDPGAVSPSGRYRGKYQFSYSTWRTVGGSGDPAAASETEQDRRAAILYRTGGPGHWPVCGR